MFFAHCLDAQVLEQGILREEGGQRVVGFSIKIEYK